MLSVDEARSRVLTAVAVLESIERPVRESRGYVVAADLAAPHSLPRFDNSAMDGYAVKAEDVSAATEQTPVTLRLDGEVRAGDPGDLEVTSGAAVRIMTGAPLPPGADAIVPVEVTEETDGKVVVKQASPSGKHVRPAGDDVQEGEVVVRAGSELTAGEMALLASLGLSPVPVVRRPRVGILVTGDELVAPEEEPGPGQIRDSNSVALTALVEEAGGEAMTFRAVGDERESTVDALARAAESADLVVSSGGVSVGRYDFVKDAVERLGRIDAWRVAMQPGKPVVLGAVGDTPFLGLPGNPVSIHAGFEQFVRPAIRKMRGCRTLLRPTVTATMTETIEKVAGRLHFVRVRLALRDDEWLATPTGPQGSHIQSSLVECDGLARFEREATTLATGDRVVVEVWRLPQMEER